MKSERYGAIPETACILAYVKFSTKPNTGMFLIGTVREIPQTSCQSGRDGN
jgi:hypothetical protein